MGGCVSERGDLVVVAGNAVQGLCDVSCPLQNDLLRSAKEGKGFVVYGGFFYSFTRLLMPRSWVYGKCARLIYFQI